jgi:hypothetical protein
MYHVGCRVNPGSALRCEGGGKYCGIYILGLARGFDWFIVVVKLFPNGGKKR